MNKADYQMVGYICLGLACLLSTGAMLTSIIVQYEHSSLLWGAGIILFVISLGFSWRARQEK